MKVYVPKVNAEGVYEQNPRYKEILRLHNMLDKERIPHYLRRNFDGWQITYPCFPPPDEKIVVSVIEHFGSYGQSDDKLEIMGLLTQDEQEYDSVVGWLTAEDVFGRIQKHWRENNV